MKFIRTVNYNSDYISSLQKSPDLSDLSKNSSLLIKEMLYTERKDVVEFKYIRVSDLSDLCVREYYLYNINNASKEIPRDLATLVNFDLGSAVHFWLQNKSFFFGDSIVGYWKCLVCKQSVFGKKPKINCPFCNANFMAFVYDELFFQIETPYRVRGKIDLILERNSIYRFGEIKTATKSQKLPREEDKKQLLMYMYLYSYFPNKHKLPITIDTSLGYLIYFLKDVSAFDKNVSSVLIEPVKMEESYIADYIDKCKEFANAVYNQTLPAPYINCVKNYFSNNKALNCKYREICLNETKKA